MADSKNPFQDDSESTVRIDLNTLKGDSESGDPMLDMDSLLSEDPDLTFSDPDEPVYKPQKDITDFSDLDQELDALADDVFNEKTSFEDTFSAPKTSGFNAEKTVILGPESMIDEGDDLPDPDQTHRLETPAPTPQQEPEPDFEHPSWQQAHLEHPEKFEHPETPPQPQQPAPAAPAVEKTEKPSRQKAQQSAPPAAPKAAHPTAAARTTQTTRFEPNSGNRLSMLISLAAAIIGLMIGAGGIWKAVESDKQAAVLLQDLSELQTRMVQMRKSNDAVALEKRIAELERELAAAKAPAETATAPEPVAAEPEKTDATPPEPAAQAAAAPVVQAPTQTATRGDWVIYLASHLSAAAAEGDIERFAALGITAEQRSALVRGQTWHRVVLPGFASKDAATTYLAKIRRDHGISGAWVGKEN